MRSFQLLTALTSSCLMATCGLAAQVSINNHCNFPVYLWTAGDTTSSMSTLTPQSTHTEPYQTRAGGSGGVSIKLARQPTLFAAGTAVSQLEYTAGADALWYDLSNINGNAFADARVVLSPQAEWTGSCAAVDCPRGAVCHAAYTSPTDDWATHACSPGTGLVLDLCVAD